MGAGSLSTLRFGPRFSYRIPAAPGVYLVRLLFVEPNQTQPLRRLFKVSVNGQESPVLDLVALAGPKTVYTLTTPAVSYWGQIVLDFTGIVGNAIVNTIEVERSAVPLTLQTVAESYECIQGAAFGQTPDAAVKALAQPGCSGIYLATFYKPDGNRTDAYIIVRAPAGVPPYTNLATWRPASIP